MNDDVSRFTLLNKGLDMLIKRFILFCVLRSVLFSKDCKRAEKQHGSVRWGRRWFPLVDAGLAWLPVVARRCSMRRRCNEVKGR